MWDYFRTFKLLDEFGFQTLVAWWAQSEKKIHDDADDHLWRKLQKLRDLDADDYLLQQRCIIIRLRLDNFRIQERDDEEVNMSKDMLDNSDSRHGVSIRQLVDFIFEETSRNN